MLYVQLLIAAIPKVPPQQTVLCIDSGRLVSGEDDDDDDDKETIKVCNQAGMKEARKKRRAGVRFVFVCFEGEGRRLAAAFSEQLFGISCCRLPWEKISEEKKGMEWDDRKREDGRGERKGSSWRTQEISQGKEEEEQSRGERISERGEGKDRIEEVRGERQNRNGKGIREEGWIKKKQHKNK